MSLLRAFGWGEQTGGAQVFAGPVMLWNWAELVVLNGQGPTVRDLIS
ncbi:hypothetical protein [Nocardia sp. NPDC005825]